MASSRTVLAAVLLAAALGPLAATAEGKGETPAWRAVEQVRDGMFDVQAALLLDEPASARRLATRARLRFRGPAARELRAAAPSAYADARRSLDAGVRAATRGDEVALAGARGRLRAALFQGSYVITIAAIRRGDATRARQWLLVREFRKATRFSRLGVDATVAIRDLGKGEVDSADAALAVKKDLLDAYQARLLDALGDAEQAHERGFDSRLAETASIAAGYWKILAPEYRVQRGPKAAAAAGVAFTRLEREALAGSAGRFEHARRGVLRSLHAFTAAPFTAEEQARRAQQLIRFLDLVPVEYGRGVNDGHVTAQFEIEEAIAFRDGAQSAFSDLEAVLERRDPRRTAVVASSLDALKSDLEQTISLRRVAPEQEIEAAHDRAANALDFVMPEQWKESSSQSDFDLVSLTLDRMEAAIGAGRWGQAEQARLEAYAFFEFGPELTLRSLAPSIASRVEGLIWFGADGKPGLAALIANHRPRRDERETRIALDEALAEGAGTLGDGTTTTTVVINSAVIVFREGLEAVLILAAVMASLTGASQVRRKPMLIGAGFALVASAVTFMLAQTVLTSLARYGEKLEAVVGLIAIAVLLLILNWFFHRVYWTQHISKFHKRRRRLLDIAGGGLVSAQVLGFVLLGFSTVYREGFETVLFLQALELNSGMLVVLEGVLLGLAAVAAVAIVTFKLERKLPYKRMLIATGLLLTLVLVIMVGKTARTMQGVGWLPITPLDLDLPYWVGLWLGGFPTVETFSAQVAAAVLVIGSYLVAERIRRPRSSRAPAPAAATPSRHPASARH